MDRFPAEPVGNLVARFYAVFKCSREIVAFADCGGKLLNGF